MLSFSKGGDQTLFEFFVQVTLGFDAKNKEYSNVFPPKYNLPTKMKNIVGSYCFPLIQNELVKWEPTTCINHFDDPDSSQNDSYLYIYIRYAKNETGVVASCIVSRFLYPELFFYLLQICCEKTDVLSHYHQVNLKTTPYDMEISQWQEHKLPVHDGLSDQCQIAYFHKYFISNFPPYYIPLLMSLLFFDSKIFVCSSSFKHLTLTVLSIVSFFYPLNIPVFAKPMLIYNDIDKIPITGLAVIGVHTTMLKNLLDSPGIIFNADEPYICNKINLTIPDKLYFEMDKFQNDISNLCLNTQPSFPAPFLLKRIQAYVALMVSVIFEIPNIDFQKMSNVYQIKQKEAKSGIGRTLADSVLMKILFEQSQNDENVRTAFWEDVGGEIEMFGRTKSLSIRRVPIPKQISTNEKIIKKKERKNWKTFA